MIVVVIIGLLAAIAIPAYLNSRNKSVATGLANNFRTYAAAFNIYATEKGSWPADVNRGIIPAGMEGNLPKFTEVSAAGGYWDWDYESVGVTAAVTLIGSSASRRLAQKVDDILDNGNLSSGMMILDGDKLIYILER